MTEQRKSSTATSKKSYGNDGEQQAADYLTQNGYQIIKRNFRCRQGEIDLIAREGGYLCFIEVKRRKNLLSGYPQEAVSPEKIRRICRTALCYLNLTGAGENAAVRFDLVVILGESIELIRNAFSFCY